MEFESNDFRCDVDVYRSSDSIAIRFYDRSLEQSEDQIVDLVLVKESFGYLTLKFIGESGDGLLSGFLNDSIFSREIGNDAIDFLESLADRALGYIPHQVSLVKLTGAIEYNGEY